LWEPMKVASRPSIPRAKLTVQEKVCYNLPTGHGQMLRVVGSLWESARFTSLRFPVDKTPEFSYMGLEPVDTGDPIDSKKDRKIKVSR